MVIAGDGSKQSTVRNQTPDAAVCSPAGRHSTSVVDFQSLETESQQDFQDGRCIL